MALFDSSITPEGDRNDHTLLLALISYVYSFDSSITPEGDRNFEEDDVATEGVWIVRFFDNPGRGQKRVEQESLIFG